MILDPNPSHIYNVQCLNGHFYSIPVGSPLEERCKAREERGYLDALIISCDECEECQIDREISRHKHADWIIDMPEWVYEPVDTED